MARIVSDDHEALDARITHSEQLEERGQCHRLGILSTEQRLLQQPLVQEHLETDAAID